MENRLKIFRVSKELLIALFQQREGYQVIFAGMPEDAKLIGISDHAYFDYDQVALKIWSASFPEIMKGDRLLEFSLDVSEKYDVIERRGPEFL